MGSVFVLVDRSPADGTVNRSTCALLTIARRLGTPVGVLCGPVDPASIATLGEFGAGTVLTVTAPEVDKHPAAATVETLAQLAGRLKPTTILIAASVTGQEVAARLAVRLDSGLVTDAIDIRPSPAGPVAVQSMFSGRLFAESIVAQGIPIFAVRTEAIAPEPAPVDPSIRRVHIAFPDRIKAVRLVSRVTRTPSARPDLATAEVVVAGGQGVGSRQSFDLVEQVADALGGAVGGSHTAAELGWCPRAAQVDQVGTIVHPRLYFALGISGSARHRAAMQTAATIVAIDRDPTAPIFGIADIGVIGDVDRVVPDLLAEIRWRKVDQAMTTTEVTEE